MLIVGLTGGIGSGKTCVSDLFKNLGVPIIDTDVISRDLVNNNRAIQKVIIDTFGAQVSTEDGYINRKQLAQIIFNDSSAKQLLENILHPKIRTEVKSQLQQYGSQTPPPQYVIIVIPLLFEANSRDLESKDLGTDKPKSEALSYQDLIDRTLVITADENTRIERIIQRDDRKLNEIQSIIASQVTDEKRVSAADDIIENDENIAVLSAQVQSLHQNYSRICNLSK